MCFNIIMGSVCLRRDLAAPSSRNSISSNTIYKTQLTKLYRQYIVIQFIQRKTFTDFKLKTIFQQMTRIYISPVHTGQWVYCLGVLGSVWLAALCPSVHCWYHRWSHQQNPRYSMRFPSLLVELIVFGGGYFPSNIAQSVERHWNLNNNKISLIILVNHEDNILFCQ